MQHQVYNFLANVLHAEAVRLSVPHCVAESLLHYAFNRLPRQLHAYTRARL